MSPTDPVSLVPLLKSCTPFVSMAMTDTGMTIITPDVLTEVQLASLRELGFEQSSLDEDREGVFGYYFRRAPEPVRNGPRMTVWDFLE